MPRDYSAYHTRRILAEYEVPELAPGQLMTSVQSGSSTVGTSQIVTTYAMEGQTATTADDVAEIQGFGIRAPIDANGSRPDLLIRINIGQKTLEGLQITGTDALNMFPMPDRVIGGYDMVVWFGHSTLLALQLAQAVQRGRLSADSLPPNLPLRLAGPKIPPNTPWTISVISKAGWGQSAAAIQPAKITLFGEQIQSSVLAAYGSAWPTIAAFSVYEPPYGGFSGTHVLSAPLTAETWNQLPGGLGQSGPVSIQPEYRDVVNAQAISSAATRYVFSNLTALGGQAQSVTLFSDPTNYNQAEVGDLASPQNAFVWQYLGFMFDPSQITSGANPQMYVGLRVDSGQTTIPGNGNGRLISLRDNPFAWGRQYPQGPDGARYLPLPDVRLFGSVLSYQNGIAPQVSVQGLTGLPAYSVHVLKGGLRVVGSGLVALS